ncbi:probable transcription factor PosF21 [Dioscorea cayenensis subsp. rotundata]|uniref:Probable transcription factor PosF21 n=1 Tax=Dioscorea cayennensis subsp. rotundata TaxID=55577 RepID=A0AB40ATN0_DIOCR|nr:probable transcription factor PosF21 [Dioscorea cayenensis subsp. rotundata]
MENSGTAAGTTAGGLPPLTSRFTAAFGVKPESQLPSSLDGDAGGRLFSKDVSSMPDLPPRNHGHRRARSEILSLPDDISFDSDLGVVGADGPSLSDETDEDVISLFMDVEKLAASCAESSGKALVGFQMENAASELNARPKIRHQHSLSMDGSASIKPEFLMQGNEVPTLAETKKAMSAQQLAELARIDPKRAKRIWANRQSAARSKERKMRYIQELERRVQTLQTEATTLSAQLTMLQRDTTGLTAENNELKLRLQTMEQQVHLQDALNDALREEVQRLKLATGQLNMVSNSGQMVGFGGSNYGLNQQFFSQNQSMQSLLAAQQLQQLQIHSHQHPQQQQQQQLSHQNQLQHQPQQTQQQTSMKTMGVLNSPNQNETSSSSNAGPKE